MGKAYSCHIFALIWLVLCFSVNSFADSRQNPSSFDRFQRSQAEQYNRLQHSQAEQSNRLSGFQSEQSGKWMFLQLGQSSRWDEVQRQIKSRWQTVTFSAKKRWVEYSKDLNDRSIVDFGSGKITIETMVLADEGNVDGIARSNINKKLKQTLDAQDSSGNNILDGQIAYANDTHITPNRKSKKSKSTNKQRKGNKIKQDLLIDKTIKKAPLHFSKPFTAKDGKKRVVASVTLPMVKDHKERRMRKYYPIVEKYSNKYDVPKELVLSIIDAESAFNPVAVSGSGAYGLMQIIPTQAGRDSYSFIYQKNVTVPPSYLFNPDNNIRFGVVYLHLLGDKHWGDIKSVDKNRYLTIASYNWGIGNVKRVAPLRVINKTSSPTFYRYLKNKVPLETKQYLDRVEWGIPAYNSWIVANR